MVNTTPQEAVGQLNTKKIIIIRDPAAVSSTVEASSGEIPGRNFNNSTVQSVYRVIGSLLIMSQIAVCPYTLQILSLFIVTYFRSLCVEIPEEQTSTQGPSVSGH